MKYCVVFLLFFQMSWAQKLITEDDIIEKKYGLESVFSLRADGSPLNGSYKIAQGMGEYYEATFADGKLNGVAKYYDRKGSINMEVTFKNGKVAGLTREYYPNGNVKKEGIIEDGIQNGFYKEYAPYGAIRYEMNYKNGELEGKFIEYSSGKPSKEGTYKNGKLDGEWKEYDDDGKVVVIEHYKLGKKADPCYLYNDNFIGPL